MELQLLGLLSLNCNERWEQVMNPKLSPKVERIWQTTVIAASPVSEPPSLEHVVWRRLEVDRKAGLGVKRLWPNWVGDAVLTQMCCHANQLRNLTNKDPTWT